jgi:hypothetical protein
MNRDAATEIADTLPQFYGSAHFTKWSPLTKSVLTDGTLYLAEKAEAFWLFDVIDSHVTRLGEDMVQSIINVQEDNTATVELDDMNENIIASQLVPYTDFPLKTVTIWSIHNGQSFTHMLPSEY